MTRNLRAARMARRPRAIRLRSMLLMLASVSSACGSNGGSADGGLPSPYAGSGWAAIHADNRNSDSTWAVGAADLRPAFHAISGRLIAAGATVGPEGHLYVGVGPKLAGSTDPDCFLFALDETTGDVLWCSGEVNGLAVASSALVDREGNLYHGDDRAMVSFRADGSPRWRTAIEGFPISAQFTPDGRLLFMTQIGRIYVLDRSDGALAMPVFETLPDVHYDPATSTPFDCFTGSSNGTCYAANTPSIDFETGRFYFTLTDPAAPPTKLVAKRYVGGSDPRIEDSWENAALEGGSASSPDISSDGSRLYLNDAANHVLALDAETGAVIWTYDLGFSPLGSLSTADDGTIIPTGNLNARALAIRDAGDHAELLWSREEFGSRSIAVQTRNGLAYVVGTASGDLTGLVLYVLNARSGAILDREPVSSGAATVGTSMSRSGRVFVPTLADGIYAFTPADPG